MPRLTCVAGYIQYFMTGMEGAAQKMRGRSFKDAIRTHKLRSRNDHLKNTFALALDPMARLTLVTELDSTQRMRHQPSFEFTLVNP